MWQFFMEVVAQSDCQVFVVENVRNLLTCPEGKAIIARARELGLVIGERSYGILNDAEVRRQMGR
jgi:site-specific DNA-cytosine methylase